MWVRTTKRSCVTPGVFRGPVPGLVVDSGAVALPPVQYRLWCLFHVLWGILMLLFPKNEEMPCVLQNSLGVCPGRASLSDHYLSSGILALKLLLSGEGHGCWIKQLKKTCPHPFPAYPCSSFYDSGSVLAKKDLFWKDWSWLHSIISKT